MSCSSVRTPYRHSVRGTLRDESELPRQPAHGSATPTIPVPRVSIHERVDDTRRGVSPSALAAVWNEALPHLRFSDPAIRSDACHVIARCMHYIHTRHLPMPMMLSVDDAAIVWSWIVERLPNRTSGITPLIAGVDVTTRQRLWSLIRNRFGGTDQWRMAVICQQIPPTLVPDVMTVIPSLLTSTAPHVQTAAMHVVMRWSRDPSPTIRSQIVTIVRSLLDQGAVSWTTVFDCRHVPCFSASTPLASDPSMTSDIVAACTHENIDVATTMIAALHDVPYPVRMSPAVMTALAQAIRRAKYQDICEQVAHLMMETVRMNDPPTAIEDWVHLLWDMLMDSSFGCHRRDAVMKCLRTGLQWEPAATMICDRVRTTPSLPEVLPISLLSDLVRVPWTPTIAETFLDLAESLIHSPHAGLVPVIVGEGWGSGSDARILRILTDHPNLINNPVDRIMAFRNGMRSPLLPSLCDLIRSVAPNSADAELVRLYGTIPDMAFPDRSDDRWSWVVRVSDHAVRALTLPVLKRIWEDHPGLAYEIARRIIEMHASAPESYLDAIQSLSVGWGCGLDRFIADQLIHEVKRKKSFSTAHQQTVMRVIIQSAAAGIGRADPRLITNLFTQIITPSVSHRTRIAVATALQTVWSQGDPTTVLRILQMTRKHHAPDVFKKPKSPRGD